MPGKQNGLLFSRRPDAWQRHACAEVAFACRFVGLHNHNTTNDSIGITVLVVAVVGGVVVAEAVAVAVAVAVALAVAVEVAAPPANQRRS